MLLHPTMMQSPPLSEVPQRCLTESQGTAAVMTDYRVVIAAKKPPPPIAPVETYSSIFSLFISAAKNINNCEHTPDLVDPATMLCACGVVMGIPTANDGGSGYTHHQFSGSGTRRRKKVELPFIDMSGSGLFGSGVELPPPPHPHRCLQRRTAAAVAPQPRRRPRIIINDDGTNAAADTQTVTAASVTDVPQPPPPNSSTDEIVARTAVAVRARRPRPPTTRRRNPATKISRPKRRLTSADSLAPPTPETPSVDTCAVVDVEADQPPPPPSTAPSTAAVVDVVEQPPAPPLPIVEPAQLPMINARTTTSGMPGALRETTQRLFNKFHFTDAMRRTAVLADGESMFAGQWVARCDQTHRSAVEAMAMAESISGQIIEADPGYFVKSSRQFHRCLLTLLIAVHLRISHPPPDASSSTAAADSQRRRRDDNHLHHHHRDTGGLFEAFARRVGVQGVVPNVLSHSIKKATELATNIAADA